MQTKLMVSNFITTVKQHYPIVLIFVVLFIVFFISSVNTQRYLDSQSQRLDENDDKQTDTRNINNEFRNLTLYYLSEMNQSLNNHIHNDTNS